MELGQAVVEGKAKVLVVREEKSARNKTSSFVIVAKRGGTKIARARRAIGVVERRLVKCYTI